MLSRAGTSLAELLLALALAGVVLAATASTALRQQRGTRWVGALTGAESQVRPVTRLLPDELATLDASAGDVTAGQASDTSLQLRVVVASSLACDSATSVVTLVADAATGVPLGGVARAPAAGDSLWYYGGDSIGWRARAVLSASRVTTGCGRPAVLSGATHRLALDVSIDASGGTPLRITRQERWVVYRASDGRWYFGIRDWSPVSGRFLPSQPVAGPFVRAIRSGERTGFRYFDASGAEIVPDGVNERSIARVRVTALSAVAALSGSDSVRRDSADAVLARRDAP